MTEKTKELASRTEEGRLKIKSINDEKTLLRCSKFLKYVGIFGTIANIIGFILNYYCKDTKGMINNAVMQFIFTFDYSIGLDGMKDSRKEISDLENEVYDIALEEIKKHN